MAAKIVVTWRAGAASLSIKEKTQEMVRREILQQAAELFAARGFRATTLDQVAQAVGFTKPALYHYFANKQALLWGIFETSWQRYFEKAEEVARSDLPPRERFRRMIYTHIEQVIQGGPFTTIYFRDEVELTDDRRVLLKQKKRAYDALFEQVYTAGVAAGVFRDFHPHAIVSGILGACNSLHTWYRPSGPVTADEISEQYVELLAGGYEL